MSKSTALQRHIVVNYLGHRGAGMEYALEMTRGLLDAGYDVSAIICSDVEDLPLWRDLPLRKLVTVTTGDHYKGALLPALRLLAGKARRIADEVGYDADILYIPMVNPLSILFERIYRRKGVKTIFTLHDVVPHPDRLPVWLRPNPLAAKYLARKANYVALLSRSLLPLAVQKHHRRPEDFIITPHGAFHNLERTPLPVAPPISKVNFLFFGRIVKYKGLELLARAYARIEAERGVEEVSLRVVGAGDMEEYRAELAKSRNVHIDNRFIDPEEIPALLRMPGTVLVLPYTEASQSGIIPQALHEQVPVITTDMPGLLEQTGEGRFAIVCRPQTESLTRALRQACDDGAELSRRAAEGAAHIATLAWPVIAANMVTTVCNLAR